MVKRVVDERKTADGIKQATQHKDWRRYISHGHPDLPNGEQFDDLLKWLDDAEIAQAAATSASTTTRTFGERSRDRGQRAEIGMSSAGAEIARASSFLFLRVRPPAM